jgi:hypothetical protein
MGLTVVPSVSTVIVSYFVDKFDCLFIFFSFSCFVNEFEYLRVLNYCNICHFLAVCERVTWGTVIMMGVVPSHGFVLAKLVKSIDFLQPTWEITGWLLIWEKGTELSFQKQVSCSRYGNLAIG